MAVSAPAIDTFYLRFVGIKVTVLQWSLKGKSIIIGANLYDHTNCIFYNVGLRILKFYDL